MPRKYRSQPLRRLRADGEGDWVWIDPGMADTPSLTVYEIDPADHWQKLGILGPDGRPIEYYAGPDVLGFLNFDEEEGEE